MAWNLIAGTIGQGAGTTLSTIAAQRQANLQNRKLKNAMSDYPYTPYSGYKPPAIDTDKKKILRPTQEQLFEILMKRSRGEDVGYDPKRSELMASLVKNELAMQEEDQLRSAQGAISSSGLSGNPRAYEAMAGRVKRDTGRNLENSMSRIAIEDLTRANEERDVNTSRLQDMNTFNFGQENNRADFDLDLWNAEETAKQGRTNIGLDYAGLVRDPYAVGMSTMGSGLSNWGSGMTSMGMGSGQNNQPAVQNVSGQGIAPQRGYYSSLASDPYAQRRTGRNLSR